MVLDSAASATTSANRFNTPLLADTSSLRCPRRRLQHQAKAQNEKTVGLTPMTEACCVDSNYSPYKHYHHTGCHDLNHGGLGTSLIATGSTPGGGRVSAGSRRR